MLPRKRHGKFFRTRLSRAVFYELQVCERANAKPQPSGNLLNRPVLYIASLGLFLKSAVSTLLPSSECIARIARNLFLPSTSALKQQSIRHAHSAFSKVKVRSEALSNTFTNDAVCSSNADAIRTTTSVRTPLLTLKFGE